MESSSKNGTTDLTNTDEKNNNTEDGLVNGVTEDVLNRVYTPADSQAAVYNSIATPMVDGLFPSSNNGDASNGNSALLFSSEITHTASGDNYTAINTLFRSQLSKPPTNVISTNSYIITTSQIQLSIFLFENHPQIILNTNPNDTILLSSATGHVFINK